jgi:hypothetical protein
MGKELATYTGVKLEFQSKPSRGKYQAKFNLHRYQLGSATILRDHSRLGLGALQQPGWAR